jgi:uncharacterized protein DUF3303
MKYMIAWKIQPGCYKEAAEAFASAGAPAPEGVTTISRCHAPGTGYGWHVIESDDGAAISHHIAEWAQVIDYQITPAIEDSVAASGISKVYGK